MIDGLRRQRIRLRRLRARRPPPRAIGLTRLEPVSRAFGFDRGTPIDRWYIERFIDAHSADVRGRVLEVGEPTYTRRHGNDGITRSDVLVARQGIADATIVGDLMTGEGIPAEAFDCFICTHTYTYTYDLAAAVRGSREALAPGGVLLAAVPGIAQISREDRRHWGEWWRFTVDSTRRLFGEAFGEENIDVQGHGNVLAASSFLYGFAAEELSDAELSHHDDDYQFLMTVRGVRPRS